MFTVSRVAPLALVILNLSVEARIEEQRADRQQASNKNFLYLTQFSQAIERYAQSNPVSSMQDLDMQSIANKGYYPNSKLMVNDASIKMFLKKDTGGSKAITSGYLVLSPKDEKAAANYARRFAELGYGVGIMGSKAAMSVDMGRFQSELHGKVGAMSPNTVIIDTAFRRRAMMYQGEVTTNP
jgi:hypothetical protein